MNWNNWFNGPLRAEKNDEPEGSGSDKNGKDDKVEDKKIKEDLSDDEIASAKSLYKALKDPDTAQEIVESMARRAGILDKKGEPEGTKQETKRELGRITKKLRSSLGKDFEKFSDIVGPALDEAIAEILEEKFGEAESNTKAETWEKSVDKFTDTHVTTNKVENKMQELIKRNPPNLSQRGFKAGEYLEDMWELAHKKLGISLPEIESKGKSGVNRLVEVMEQEGPKKATLDDAIDAALKGIRFKKR